VLVDHRRDLVPSAGEVEADISVSVEWFTSWGQLASDPSASLSGSIIPSASPATQSGIGGLDQRRRSRGSST
jgi:hypothetical protein